MDQPASVFEYMDSSLFLPRCLPCPGEGHAYKGPRVSRVNPQVYGGVEQGNLRKSKSSVKSQWVVDIELS